MTCPVPRETSDSERILKWLGFRQGRGAGWWKWYYPDGDTDYVNSTCPVSTDPSLDYLVLEKVRGLGLNARDQFAHELNNIWWRRGDTMARAALEYLPGDYAEAARCLWEGE